MEHPNELFGQMNFLANPIHHTQENKLAYRQERNTRDKCQSLPIYFIQNSSNVEYGNYLLLPHTQAVNIPSQCIQFGGEG